MGDGIECFAYLRKGEHSPPYSPPSTQHAVGSGQSAVTRKGTRRREEVLKSKIPFADFSKNRNPTESKE